MSDIIELIERLGRDSQLRHASRATLERALAGEPMSPEIRSALASGDRQQLERLLAAAGNECCLINAPLENEEEDEADQGAQAAPEGAGLPLGRVA